jgi:hypothetical protein
LTQVELCAALKTLGLPVAYSEFTASQEPPFICYVFQYSNDTMADNQNYIPISRFDIELYTANKDPALETRVQNLLKSLKLAYVKREAYIEEEKMRQILYEIKIIGG